MCNQVLISLLLSPSPPLIQDTSQNAALLSHILDILSLCVEKHTYLIRNYIIDKNVLSRVLVLMTSAHAHLALGMTYTCTEPTESVRQGSCRIFIWGNVFKGGIWLGEYPPQIFCMTPMTPGMRLEGFTEGKNCEAHVHLH